jgi:ATP diphosphatase
LAQAVNVSVERRNGGITLAGENLPKLVELMERLRGPDGCPWDRAQNYDSVKGLLLEEAYEVVDAVSARDFGALEDELGDLLFQVVFYSRLAEEEKRFTIDGVVERVRAKLVRRHPHVFGDVVARTPEAALKSWNAVKEAERHAASAGAAQTAPYGSLLDGIAKSLPSTVEAMELSVRVAAVGFDWVKVEDLLAKIEEEIKELREELSQESLNPGEPNDDGHSERRIEEEVGDLMFSVANLARYVHSDPESCLRRANQKFKRRFQSLEREVLKQGKKVRNCEPQELDSFWRTVKMQEQK